MLAEDDRGSTGRNKTGQTKSGAAQAECKAGYIVDRYLTDGL